MVMAKWIMKVSVLCMTIFKCLCCVSMSHECFFYLCFPFPLCLVLDVVFTFEISLRPSRIRLNDAVEVTSARHTLKVEFVQCIFALFDVDKFLSPLSPISRPLFPCFWRVLIFFKNFVLSFRAQAAEQKLTCYISRYMQRICDCKTRFCAYNFHDSHVWHIATKSHKSPQLKPCTFFSLLFILVKKMCWLLLGSSCIFLYLCHNLTPSFNKRVNQ